MDLQLESSSHHKLICIVGFHEGAGIFVSFQMIMSPHRNVSVGVCRFHHPVDTGRKLNVHKTFRRRPGRLLNF